jgi:hypothetical protein
MHSAFGIFFQNQAFSIAIDSIDFHREQLLVNTFEVIPVFYYLVDLVVGTH